MTTSAALKAPEVSEKPAVPNALSQLHATELGKAFTNAFLRDKGFLTVEGRNETPHFSDKLFCLDQDAEVIATTAAKLKAAHAQGQEAFIAALDEVRETYRIFADDLMAPYFQYVQGTTSKSSVPQAVRDFCFKRSIGESGQRGRQLDKFIGAALYAAFAVVEPPVAESKKIAEKTAGQVELMISI